MIKIMPHNSAVAVRAAVWGSESGFRADGMLFLPAPYFADFHTIQAGEAG